MTQPEETPVSFIPSNFIEKGKILNGTFDIRNAIESIVLSLAIGIPVFHLPLSLTARIIILCMTALPAAMVALIGIGGESITAFLMNALRFVVNRRVIWRSDSLPEGKPRRKPRFKEPKTKKHRKAEKMAEPSKVMASAPPQSEPDAPAPPKSKKKEHRQFDTSTKRGIKKQAKEDIRYLKWEQKEASRQKKEAAKQIKIQKKTEARRRKEEEKRAVSEKRAAKKEQKKKVVSKEDTSSATSKPVSRKKRKKDQTLEDYLPVEKIANGIVYTTDGRYVKILEIEPINFLLRSAREQQGIIYSFISYLKISPVKLQIKMISKKADINKHLEQSQLELERETDPHCQELQRDYIQFVQNLSSREAVSRRFFLIFEYEPFNANRKEEEREILAALETASQTAKTFLYQCGNEVVSHDNEDEFTTDVLYTLLNRTLCTEVPLSNRISTVLSAYTKENRMEELDHIRINEFLAPESVDFKHSHYVQINGLYHSYLLVPSDGYKNRVTPGWLSLLVNAGEGIDIDFFLQKQPKDKIQQRLGQQIRINRSKLKDASDTNTDYDDLDSAIRSGYFLKQGLANNEDFYYMNLLITITASTLEELQWRIQEMKKLLISQDMNLHSCYFLQEQGFLSSLPLANLDKKLFKLSKRNVLTSGAASCYPFVSYSICDDNGILFGVNKHNNSLVIADIFDSRQYKNSNICILGCSGAGKTFTMQTMALRMRRKGIQVFIIAPLKGHEFYRAARNVGGEFIQISPASKNCINIMEIRKVDNSVNELLDGPTLDASALAGKIQRLHIFFSLLIPDMSHEEKQLLDEALIKTYARKGITHKNESLTDPQHPEQYKKMPILEDVYNVLLESEDTKRLAHILNRLVHGSASSFNQQTNVDLTNKYTVLDISELTGSSDLLTVGMFVALDYVWDKAKENRTEEKAIFVDEVWQLIGASSNRLVFEELYQDEMQLAVHTDINDEDQTIYFPEIKTTAKDADTNSNISCAKEEITLVDTVSFKGLVPNQKYEVTGTLIDKETKKPVEADGKPVTAKASFKPKESAGTVDVTFTFDASSLKGKTVVVFESLAYKDKEVAVHTDIADEGQTIYFPEIKTTATDAASGTHYAKPEKELTLTDLVEYKNLIPGKEYKLTGTLMDAETEKPFDVDGKAVTAETSFTPEEANGSVELSFTFDASALSGKTLVAFETMTFEDHEVAVHADIKDANQTIYFPEIKTTAKDGSDGDQDVSASKEATIVDTVTYHGLMPGSEYKVIGTLMNKETGEALLKDGKPVTAQAEFKAEKAGGSVEVTFTFDASALAGQDVVVFEKLYYTDGKTEHEIASHEDLKDEGQTVHMTELPKEPETPPVAPPVKTGDETPLLLYAGIAIAALAGASVLGIVYFKRKKKHQ